MSESLLTVRLGNGVEVQGEQLDHLDADVIGFNRHILHITCSFRPSSQEIAGERSGLLRYHTNVLTAEEKADEGYFRLIHYI